MTDILVDNLEELWTISDNEICCEGAGHDCDNPAFYTTIWSYCCPMQNRRNYYCEACFNAWYDPEENERIAECLHCGTEIVMERFFRIK